MVDLVFSDPNCCYKMLMSGVKNPPLANTKNGRFTQHLWDLTFWRGSPEKKSEFSAGFVATFLSCWDSTLGLKFCQFFWFCSSFWSMYSYTNCSQFIAVFALTFRLWEMSDVDMAIFGHNIWIEACDRVATVPSMSFPGFVGEWHISHQTIWVSVESRHPKLSTQVSKLDIFRRPKSTWATAAAATAARPAVFVQKLTAQLVFKMFKVDPTFIPSSSAQTKSLGVSFPRAPLLRSCHCLGFAQPFGLRAGRTRSPVARAHGEATKAAIQMLWWPAFEIFEWQNFNQKSTKLGVTGQSSTHFFVSELSSCPKGGPTPTSKWFVPVCSSHRWLVQA